MENLVSFLGMIYNLFNLKMNVYGFEFSFWDIIMFTLIIGVIFAFIRRMFYDN